MSKLFDLLRLTSILQAGLMTCLVWLSLAPLFANAFTASVSTPEVCAHGCAEIRVTDYGVIPNDGQDDSPGLNALLERFPKNAIIQFPPGTYDLQAPLKHDQLENVDLQGDSNALLRKTNDFKGEYLFYSRFSRNLAIRGLAFQGLTRDRFKYAWGESGLYLASSNGLLVDKNRFLDFGDAAIRATTAMSGPPGVSNFNTTVQNNIFENVTQITTTSNANQRGGTSGFLLENNEFRNLKGSVKFASRTPGAGQVIITGNRIYGVPTLATSVGIEIVSYSNIFVEKNHIADCGNFAVNIYSNPAPGIQGFDWGQQVIRNNTIQNCAKGIRVSAQAYKTGYIPKVSQIHILDNAFQNIQAPQIITLTNGASQGTRQKNNRRS